MPAKTINMHGKIYDLADEKSRTKLQAQEFAAEIRTQGKVAFLNPQKKKGQETKYYVYEAEKSIRTSTKRNVAIETIISELDKETDSFLVWAVDLRNSFLEAQKETPKKETPKKETPKKNGTKKNGTKKNGTKKNGKKK